jgi:hypothetical protein
MNERRINDVERARLCEQANLVDLIGGSIQLKKRGKNYVGCCPFHGERTPSFNVIPSKQYFHCYGCGKNGDAITWLIEQHGLDFVEACKCLDERAFERLDLTTARIIAPAPEAVPDVRLVPLLPVPRDAPSLFGTDGWTVPIFNPGKNKASKWKPLRADEYRDGEGGLLGYVLRAEFKDDSGKFTKVTPTVTYCIKPDGSKTWALCLFPILRPLCGLDELAAKPDAPVLIVEGEKCRAASAGALPMYATVTWPGGSNGLGGTSWHDAVKGPHYTQPLVDWSAMAGRDAVLWPDADEAGQRVMLGHKDSSGRWHPGVVDFLTRAGARSIRMIDTTGQPKGWDIADALDPAGNGWSPPQLAAWAKERVVQVEVHRV